MRKDIFKLIILMLFNFFFVASNILAQTESFILLKSVGKGNPTQILSNVRQEQSGPTYDYKITINNPNSYALNDYQLRIDVSTIVSDIGYYFSIKDSNNNLISYCFEQSNGECNNNPTNIIWIKTPNIPANSSIDLHVNKENTNYALNGDQIFDFYDDFNSTTLDTNKWEVYNNNGDYSLTGTALRLTLTDIGTWYTSWYDLTSYFHLLSVADISAFDPCWIELNESAFGSVYSDDLAVGVDVNYYYISEPILGYLGLRDGAISITNASTSNFFSPGSVISILLQGDLLAYYVNGNQIFYFSDANMPAVKHIILSSDAESGYVDIEWIRVRRYANIEPTYSISKY